MKPGARNLLTDVPGLLVGNASDPALGTGVTVITADTRLSAAVHVMGGAPGTRETDLLAPGIPDRGVDAIVLAGGSAFGLDAVSGVMAALYEAGRGFPAAGHRIPIVPAAILFDLGGREPRGGAPYPALGRRAFETASPDFAIGTAGAGTGATVAGLKGGLGSASVVLDGGLTVAALVAVNALGAVTVGDGPHFWAAPFEVGGEFGGLGPAPAAGATPPRIKTVPGLHTTLAVVATDAALARPELFRLAMAAQDGMARAIVPSHTPFDGDLVFAVSTGAQPFDDALLLSHAAALCLARATARAAYEATPAPGDRFPTWRERFG